jgi:mono/diheme cytochrome c family protein
LRLGLGAAAGLAVSLAASALSAADPDLAAKGQQVFNIGGCTNCHTAKGGELLAGGDPLVTPFGTFHPPNITPDRETGIGGWSEADFIRAMREGRAPDGGAYYPAFPYTSYTRMSDEDLVALKAYLDTVPPVSQAAPPHELSFPYNQRWAIGLWQAAFFTPERFQPDQARDSAWNRGAYLVLGPGHCAECHSPRNSLGVLDWDRAFAGGDLGGPKGKVPNITSNPDDGIGKWSEGDLTTALSLGMLPNGDFLGGEMGKIVANGTGKLPPEDLRAIVAYLKSLPAR